MVRTNSITSGVLYCIIGTPVVSGERSQQPYHRHVAASYRQCLDFRQQVAEFTQLDDRTAGLQFSVGEKSG